MVLANQSFPHAPRHPLPNDNTIIHRWNTENIKQLLNFKFVASAQLSQFNLINVVKNRRFVSNEKQQKTE